MTTSKPIRLSNSSTNTLETCGEYYRLFYIERLRTKTLNSALFFGGALDLAFNELLMQKHILTPVSPEKALENAIEAFKNGMTQVDVNGTVVDPFEYEHTQYSKSDLDYRLLNLDQRSIDWVEEYQANLKIRGFKPESADKAAYNKLCYESLWKKGEMLIEHYRLEIMTKIDKVIEVQKKVELPNENGDMLTGVIDAVVQFVGDATPTVVDNKTSSKPYKESELYESKQLATYAEYMKNYQVAYIVVEKEIRKKEPMIRSQILKGTLTEEHIVKVFEQYEISLEKIRKEEFDKNESKCYNLFGRPCPYSRYCKFGTIDSTLTQLEKRV